MDERIKKAYASAPKAWVWQLLAAFIVACLLAWSGTAVRVSSSTGNGLEVARNILSGIFHPSAKLLLTLGTDGVPYLLLETFCIAFLGTIVGAVISLPLSFLSASNLVPRGVALVGRVLIAAIRTIPAFVYGLMFIRVTGPGPFAGLLTMSLCSIGMVSKMFIESIEDLDKRILESLDAAGCTTFQKIRYGILPQLTADFTSFLASYDMADVQAYPVPQGIRVEVYSRYGYETGASHTYPAAELKQRLAAAQPELLRVTVDGKPVTFPISLYQVSGCTMAPLRQMAQALGYTFDYDGSSGTAVCARGTDTISVRAASTQATVNGKTTNWLAVPAELRGGIFCVPVRFFAEAAGADVTWDAAGQTFYLTTAIQEG